MDTNPHQVLSTRLKSVVERDQLKQSDLAALMGIRQSHASELLSGRKRFGRKTLGAVRRLFPELGPYVMAVLDNPEPLRPRKKQDAA